MPLVFLDKQRMLYIAHNLETLDPVLLKWNEVAGGAAAATVRFREVAADGTPGADMSGSVAWPRPLSHAGAGTRRWYAEIDGAQLTPDPTKTYEAFIAGTDQDGAEFSAREPLPIITPRRSLAG